MPQPFDVDYFATLGGSQNPAPPAPTPSDSRTANVSSCRELASVLLGDAWPPDGSRYDAHLALAGALVRGGWDDDACVAFMRGVYAVAGGGCTDHMVCLRSSRAKAAADTSYTGWPTLEKHVDPAVVDRVRDMIGMPKPPDGSVIEGFGDALPGGDPEDPLNVVTPGKKAPCSFKEVVYYLSQTPQWQGVFRFNVLSRKHVAVRPPFAMRMEQGNLSDGDIGKIRTWFDSQGFKVGADAIVAAIAVVAESPGRTYNPFVEYLDALPPSSGHLALASTLFTKTLVAAVRRCRNMPGIGQDPTPIDHQGVLLLAGEQDAGKGRLIRILAGDKFYKKIDIRRLKDKDTVIKAQGAVLVELEEVSAQGRDRDSLKAFLSSCDDDERVAYGRGSEVVPRSYAMIATTNDPRLEDPTGHRRWWPILLTPGVKIDTDMATTLRDAFWSEANALALDVGYDHHLTEGEKLQCAALCGLLEAEDTRMEDVLDACAGKAFVTTREVYNHMTKGTRKDEPPSKAEEHMISDSLKRIGCVKGRPYINGLQMKGWEVPKAFQAQAVSPEGAAYRASLEVAAGLRAITRN